MFFMWKFTVFSDTKRAAAIPRFVAPSATSCNTSRSGGSVSGRPNPEWLPRRPLLETRQRPRRGRGAQWPARSLAFYAAGGAER